MSGILGGFANMNPAKRRVNLEKAGIEANPNFGKTPLSQEAYVKAMQDQGFTNISPADYQKYAAGFGGTEFTGITGADTNTKLLDRLNIQDVNDPSRALVGKESAGFMNVLKSDVAQGLKDFATPFDFRGMGASENPFMDVGKELLSTATLAQVGQTPSQVKNAADALKDAERRYQEYLDQLSADQRASVEEDRQARIAAYKQYMGLAGYSNEEIDTALFQAGHIGQGETVYAAKGGRIGFDVGGDTGGKTDNMGIGNYIEAEKVRTEYTDKLKRMLQAEQVKMKMNDPGLMRFANALMPGGEGFYTKQEMRFPDMEARYKANIEKMKMDQAKDDYEKDQIKKQLRKNEFDDIVNMIDDRFSDNREQRKMASVGGRMTSEGDPISPDVPEGMQMDLRPGGFIPLGTKPKADDVPAMVGKNEFVLNDEAVSGIGKLLTGQPDPRAGARALYDLQSKMEAIV